jgi:hypothetical protein
MEMNGGSGEFAINLIPLRDGASLTEFERFSARVDQPTCLAHDVVQGFDAYAVIRRDEGTPAVDIVELMHVRSWPEWVEVRDNSSSMLPVTEGFERLVDPATVRTLFGRKIVGERSGG